MVAYKIMVSKDHAKVTVRYGLQVPVGGVELIATFAFNVNGANIIVGDASGNTEFTGTAFATLPDETKDATVDFSITNNLGEVADGSDVLRGEHPFDSAEFHGED
jgi:hypothetical protein